MATAEYCVKPDGAHGPTSALGAQRAPSLCSRWATDLSFVPPTSAIEVDLGKAKPLAMNLGCTSPLRREAPQAARKKAK